MQSRSIRRSGHPFVPAHRRMRAIDRDLIRGGHYGQRRCVPHSKAEHMAAPTNAANVKKALANSAPSTHGTKQTSKTPRPMSAFGGKRGALMADRLPVQVLQKPAHFVELRAEARPVARFQSFDRSIVVIKGLAR